jgi:N6-adenosine-specific RNA methylase IME4
VIEFHPLAGISFDLLEGEDFRRLCEDIRAKGLYYPITLFEGKILDGRNRYRACLETGVEPKFEEYTGPDPIGASITLNRHRRMLTTAQLALGAARLETYSHGGPRGQDAILHVAPMTRKQAAEMFGVSERSVADARRVLDQAHPEFLARIKHGGVSIERAAFIVEHSTPEVQRTLATLDDDAILKVAKKHEAKLEHLHKMDEIRSRPLVIPEGRFSVIVIDPPWPLEKVAADLEARDEEPDLPYPTMSIDQIREWGLKHFFPDKRTADDCHLFLWFPDAFKEIVYDLVRAWGFEPSRVHTWNKKTVNGEIDAHYLPGLPGYNSESVLYARRGSPRFDHIAGSGFVTCFDGVNQGHSRKPVEFYEIVRKVTEGRRIDIFSRSRHEGFEACGNEVDKFPLPEVPVGGPRIYTLEDLGL